MAPMVGEDGLAKPRAKNIKIFTTTPTFSVDTLNNKVYCDKSG